MAEQLLLRGGDNYKALERYFQANRAARLFLVCGASIRSLALDKFFQTLPQHCGIQVIRFNDFHPNPSYDSVRKGLRLFQEERCDIIAAVGGGSAIDVAKCIRLWAAMDPEQDCLTQAYTPNDVSFLAVPTTAGSGSEATHFAVIYRDGEKLSVSHPNCIPNAVLLDPAVLTSLPEYTRKCTMLDALCHALESFWSRNAGDESKAFSRAALQLLLENVDAYLQNKAAGNAAMQRAAYLAGQAIDRAQTTAGHAMAYGLTTRYGLAHGQAAALCVSNLWPYMVEQVALCTLPGGASYLDGVFQEIAKTMGCATVQAAIRRYDSLLEGLQLPLPKACEADLSMLCRGVNAQRLKNNPVPLSPAVIKNLYREILL